MAALVEGRAWARNLVGEAGAAIYRLHGRAGEPDLYLKHGAGPVADDVTDEMARLRWLAAHVELPEMRHFVASPDAAWLLTIALPGRTAYQRLESSPADAPAVVDALAQFLIRFHSIPVESCPFNSGHRLRLRQAHERMEAGLVDIDDFDDSHAGWTARQVWDEIVALAAFAPDPVVTHGDYSLDNLLLEGGAVTGCIDVGRVGVADRYQDIAILWNCLEEFGPALQRRFLAAYGIERLDEAKLRFHLGLDEFF
jgi:aminoglycoside 3'-phosphotransferase-1